MCSSKLTLKYVRDFDVKNHLSTWGQLKTKENNGRGTLNLAFEFHQINIYLISPKSFIDQLNACINRKLVSGEVQKLFFSVVKTEFNSRHYNIMHFFLRGSRVWT